jgi:hypothetical protein
MVKINLFVFLLLFAFNAAQAQTVCGIAFTYDAAGNRIKREYKCKDIFEPADKAFEVALFPNPTTGPIAVVFSEEVKSAKLRVFNMSGGEIGSKVSENCYDMNSALMRWFPAVIW